MLGQVLLTLLRLRETTARTGLLGRRAGQGAETRPVHAAPRASHHRRLWKLRIKCRRKASRRDRILLQEEAICTLELACIGSGGFPIELAMLLDAE